MDGEARGEAIEESQKLAPAPGPTAFEKAMMAKARRDCARRRRFFAAASRSRRRSKAIGGLGSNARTRRNRIDVVAVAED
jgi:hypothetical protein